MRVLLNLSTGNVSYRLSTDGVRFYVVEARERQERSFAVAPEEAATVQALTGERQFRALVALYHRSRIRTKSGGACVVPAE